MDINLNTDNGWTDAEEATFADIVRITRMDRIAAIQLFRRCKSDHTKAVRLARRNYTMTDERAAGLERSKTARLAGLAKANARRAQDGSITRAEFHA